MAHAPYGDAPPDEVRRPQLDQRPEPPGSLHIVATAIQPEQASIQVGGEMDLATAHLITEALHEQLRRGRRFVRLDLSRLTFLDCAGLRALVLAHNEFLFAGGTLILTGAGHRVARLLTLTHLDQALLDADGPGEPRRGRPCPPVAPEARR